MKNFIFQKSHIVLWSKKYKKFHFSIPVIQKIVVRYHKNYIFSNKIYNFFFLILGMLEGQEDCLYLNIYIPKIHGKGTNFLQKTLFHIILTKS